MKTPEAIHSEIDKLEFELVSLSGTETSKIVDLDVRIAELWSELAEIVMASGDYPLWVYAAAYQAKRYHEESARILRKHIR